MNDPEVLDSAPGFRVKVNCPVPPVAETEMVPSAAPLHVISVLDWVIMEMRSGSMISIEAGDDLFSAERANGKI